MQFVDVFGLVRHDFSVNLLLGFSWGGLGDIWIWILKLGRFLLSGDSLGRYTLLAGRLYVEKIVVAPSCCGEIGVGSDSISDIYGACFFKRTKLDRVIGSDVVAIK